MDIRGNVWYYKFRYAVKINRVFSTLYTCLLCKLKDIRLGSEVIFTGIPRLHRFPGSSVEIGDNCRFNSSRNAVRMGIFKPCSFVTMSKKAKIRIGKNVGGTGVTIAAAENITIGNNVLLGAYTFIMDTDWHNPNPEERNSANYSAKPVVIEDGVFLGYNSVVLKGVTIGKNSVIAANSLVVHSIPPNSLAMGNPCKVIIRRNWGNNDRNTSNEHV